MSLARPPILRLPYDASLTVAGIEYAKKSLHYTYNRMRLAPGARLRKIVAGVAVELAFRRWLEAQGVPYDLLGATPFTERDRYDLRLGGRRCDVKSFLVSDRARISALRRDPAALYAAAALVPEDQFHSDSMGEHDIYLFGFLAGLETASRAALEKALAAEQPAYLLRTFEQPGWRGADAWQSLGRLVLKTDSRAPLEVEIGGQDAARAALTQRLRLPGRTRVVTQAEFHALLYLHAPRLPGGTVGVRSPARRETLLVAPGDWTNIWIYGLEVFLAGWLTKGELRQKGRRLLAGASVWQYARTQTDNRAAPVTALRPVAELAELARRAAGAPGGA
jgi:hypothetical protein